MSPATGPISRREIVGVLIAFALLCAWPFRDALFTTERAVFGVDCATVQLPWSTEIAAAAAEGGSDDPQAERPRNPALSDQAHGFYPFYRWVSESWLGGDPPLWNPLIYAGVPGLGNPQTGALDPQVLALVALESVFGRAAFDWGLTATSWLRLVAAALGTWLLARALGLGRPGAALAATTFTFSGFLLLWLGFSLGHVAPTLPWLLWFLERLRSNRAGRAAIGVAVTTALSIYAGHPETTFYAGVAAGAWALAILREDRRRGWIAFAALIAGVLLAAPLVLPFLEYLKLSAAQLIREHRSEHTSIDFVAAGVLVIGIGLALRWRSQRWPSEGAAWSRILPVVLSLTGLALVLATRGGPVTAPLVLLPDLFGFPGDGAGYQGAGTLAEEASGWVPFVALALALAALLRGEGPLARRGLVSVLALVALLLALHTPGLLDLYRRIPSIGLGAPVRFAVVSALMLGLLAGEALESAPVTARRAAAGALLALVVVVMLRSPAGQLDPAARIGPEQDEHVAFVELPPATIGPGPVSISGWIDARLAVASARVRLEAADPSGAPLASGPRHFVPAELTRLEEGVARGPAWADAPNGAFAFATPALAGTPLETGPWRMTLEVLGASGEVMGERRIAVVERAAYRNPSSWTLVLLGLGAAAVCAPALGGALAWWVVALALVQGVFFARRVNPSVPRAEFFAESAAERILARELSRPDAQTSDGRLLGPGRYLGGEGLFPPSTGMVRGLAAVDGYDGMDVAEFNIYRSLAVRPGMHPLLGWTPRGADIEGAPFRLLGVSMLVTREPLEHPDWELIAGPGGAPLPAEVFLQRARDPLPRAFVAGAVLSADEVAANLAEWNPLEVATWDGTGTIIEPRTSWTVSDYTATNNEVRLSVDLDGDGLLVVTEQHFPGWIAEVDGEPAELATANAIFRGVLLAAGRHDVVLTYAPASLRRGMWLSVAGLLLIAAVARRSSAGVNRK